MTTISRRLKNTTLALIATATVATTIGLAATAHAEPTATPAAHGVEAPIGAVPWSQVGPGWMLAMWSPVTGRRPSEEAPAGEPSWESAATTLYLVDPAGGRYAIITFPPPGNNGQVPELADWSGDGSRALFYSRKLGGDSTVTEVDLHTGAQTTFTVNNGNGFSPRYSRPDGKAVLLANWGYGTDSGSLERVDLAGNHQLTYPVGEDFRGYLSTPDGTQLVVGTGSGLAMMGNDGAAGKALSIAGQKNCSPTRWWDADSTVVVAHCGISSQTQLWLVPIDGGTPTALTAPNYGQQGPDYGDMTAWQLPAGTYLQAAGACGVIFLAKLNADGTTSPVSVPNTRGSVQVVGVNDGHLRLQAMAGCGGGQSLLDYDPTAGTTTVLLGPTVNGGRVIDALPYAGQH
jgi:Tol biopolymer transport system component